MIHLTYYCFLIDKRHEKSWNDPPMFSAEQMNKATGSVPLSKRYRYPQAPAQAPNQMYQQQPNVGMNSGYGYQQPQGNTLQQSYGQPQQQQQYPGAFNPYGQDPNANVGTVPMSSNYQAPPSLSNVSQQQPQQYSQQQYAPSPPLMAPNAYPANANAYGGNHPNQPSQMNYNAGQFAGNQGSYNVASQFPGQQGPTEPPPPQMNYQQSQQVPPYNSQARY